MTLTLTKFFVKNSLKSHAKPASSSAQQQARRTLVHAGLAGLAGLAVPLGRAWAQAKESALPTPASFAQAARDAVQKGEPLVVLVSLPGCPWCELLRRNYLLPMRAEGLQAVQFTVNDKTQRFEGFAPGKELTGVDMSVAYKARVTPTLLFLDATGAQVAERITGVASADFLGAQLEQRLAAARLAVRAAQK